MWSVDTHVAMEHLVGICTRIMISFRSAVFQNDHFDSQATAKLIKHAVTFILFSRKNVNFNHKKTWKNAYQNLVVAKNCVTIENEQMHSKANI